jgi:predicted DNA binding CopG/RHH family protein
MSKVKKPLPDFPSEDAERRFWSVTDSTDHIAWDQAKQVEFPALKPSLRTISIRLPGPMLDRIKAMANERDVPYQSLIKMILSERIADEMTGSARQQRVWSSALDRYVVEKKF